MADFDPTKMADEFTKMAGQFNLPVFDMDAVMASQRKNIEALTAANKAAVEGMQLVAARQAEILQESLDEATKVVTELSKSGNPQDVAVCDLNNVVDYYRLSADKRLLYGGACNYSGREPASVKAYIRPRMLKVYPQLENVRIDFEWGGMIGIVLNRIPAVGRINQNVYYCQGYSGHGVNATHVMGEVVADAVAGTMEKFDLFADMKHFRIPGSQWVGNQIIALGMLYYRMKDLL